MTSASIYCCAGSVSEGCISIFHSNGEVTLELGQCETCDSVQCSRLLEEVRSSGHDVVFVWTGQTRQDLLDNHRRRAAPAILCAAQRHVPSGCCDPIGGGRRARLGCAMGEHYTQRHLQFARTLIRTVLAGPRRTTPATTFGSSRLRCIAGNRVSPRPALLNLAAFLASSRQVSVRSVQEQQVSARMGPPE